MNFFQRTLAALKGLLYDTPADKRPFFTQPVAVAEPDLTDEQVAQEDELATPRKYRTKLSNLTEDELVAYKKQQQVDWYQANKERILRESKERRGQRKNTARHLGVPSKINGRTNPEYNRAYYHQAKATGNTSTTFSGTSRGYGYGQ